MGNPVVSQKFHHLLKFEHVPHKAHAFVHVDFIVIATDRDSCGILSTVLQEYESTSGMSGVWQYILEYIQK